MEASVRSAVTKRLIAMCLGACCCFSFAHAQTQEKETVGSLAANGFEVKGGSTSGGGFVVAMQKGAEVYVCIIYSLDARSSVPSQCIRQK
jgi:hypothetical protein